VLSRNSIEEEGFIHEVLLVALRAGSVRELIAHPGSVEGPATLDGLQFVLPQVIAQSLPNQSGPFGAIKPDLPAYGGRHDVRTIAAGDNLRLRVLRETGRSGVFGAAARVGAGDLERARGVECSGRVDWRGWSVFGSGVASARRCVADEGPGGERVTLAGGSACALPG